MSVDVIGRARLEALLGGDEPRTEAEARRAGLVAELRRGVSGPAPEGLRARVLAAEPARALPGLRFPEPRRVALVALAAALAAIVALSAVRALPGPALRPAVGQAIPAVGTSPRLFAPSTSLPEAAPVAAPGAARGRGGSAMQDALTGLGGLLALAAGVWAVARVRRRRDERRLLGDA
ncbi:MAG TPA: hypothetical protein VJ986_14170 [Gaiellaceae bacterium]|nr:hypothetical protein [Gaiellaceae bacterium]